MTLQDQAILALAIWKEARNGGSIAMQSIANVVMNRVAKRGTSAAIECLRPLQFSSMTAPGDPELAIGPNALNQADWAAYLSALNIASQAAVGNLPDVTGGATDYYAPGSIKTTATYVLPDKTVVPFPHTWNPAKVSFTVKIDRQLFFKEES